MRKILTPRVRFLVAVLLLNVALLAALRAIFLAVFLQSETPLGSGTLLKSFTLGLKFDLRLALLILLPVAVLAWLPGLNLLRSRFARRLWLGYLTVAGTGLALVHLGDFAHFAYLHSRLNATALEFLQTPDISARMVWESYPVVWAVLGLAAFALGFGWVLKRTAFRVLEGERGPRQGWGRWLGRVGFAAVVIGGTSLMGGRGSILGTLIGVMIFGYLSNILNLRAVSSEIQDILKGVIIVGAAALQSGHAAGGLRSLSMIWRRG